MQDGGPSIRDIKPLHAVQYADHWALWLGLGVAVLVLVALALWWWRRRRTPEPAAPPPPAHRQALDALKALGDCDIDDDSALRRFHFALSEILRTYVEARFTLNATDLTSEEILERATRLTALQVSEQQRLREFLICTDAVKYARKRPDAPTVRQTVTLARDFILETAPVGDA